jgi:signal transduction histidine kinase
MIVGQPVFARIAKKWVIVFARRVETAEGQFAGVVYANIALEKLAAHFRSIRIGQSGSVSLRDATLGVIVRVPEGLPMEQAVGNRKVSATLEDMVRAGKGGGSYIARTSYDAVERAAAYRRLDPYPLYVTIGFAEEDFLAPWREERFGVVIAVALFVVVTLSSAWLLARTWRVQERTSAELACSKAELEHRVVERTEQLEAANRELEEFSYSMSHDMSTPLRAINGYSRLLLEEHQDRLDDEGRRLLTALGANAGRMGRLIDDILRFLGMGRRKLRPASFEMAGLVQESFDAVQRAMPGRAMRLEMSALPDVWGDADMIMVALREMISNAVKYTKSSDEALVEVEGREDGGATIYCVRDHGVGFDMRFADKLFKVFERVHATGEYEGTGIGLAIVKRVIERHGGKVWAEGTVGGGATFWFSLPQRSQPGAVPQPRPPTTA